ncbi:MAG: WG repeat-containing protein, partial [Propionicimonas sp.]
FVDTSGRRVAPPRYHRYTYCLDDAGRPARVVAGRGTGADVLDLSGTVVATLPGVAVSCLGTSYAIVVPSDRSTAAVVDLTSGAILLPSATGRGIAAVDAATVNVSEAGGEYFLDLASGRRTPHPGRVTQARLQAGVPGVPAVVPAAAGGAARFGYLGRDGRWLAAPTFDRATAFTQGHAVVTTAGVSTFLDAGLRPVGGSWDRVEPVAAGNGRIAGYQVESDGRVGLLDADLYPVVQPGAGVIVCPAAAGGACSVGAADGSASLVVLPGGGIAPLPSGLTLPVGPSLVVAGGTATRVQSLVTGRMVGLPAQTTCRGAGEAFAACRTRSGQPDVVIGADGERTPFEEVRAVPDPDPAVARVSYYWVQAGRYQGFIDARGAWLYRERRPTTLAE